MRQNYADPHAAPEIIGDLEAEPNTDAVAEKAADADQFWAVDWVGWSYDDDPTGGKVSLAWGDAMRIEVDITSPGPGMLYFGSEPALDGLRGQALTITLAAGGEGVTGKVWARVR